MIHRNPLIRWLALAALAFVVPVSAQVVEIRDPSEMEAAHRNELQQAAMALSWRLGTVQLDPVPAQIKLPAQFRLLHRSMLIRLARLHGVLFDQNSMGWIVHRDIDLGREDAWFVQVRYLPQNEPIALPSVAAPDAASKEAVAEANATLVNLIAKRVTPGMLGTAQNPAWNPDTSVATWDIGAPQGEGAPRHYFAANVLDDGVLVFAVTNLSDAHAELAQRSVRLIASRAEEVVLSPTR